MTFGQQPWLCHACFQVMPSEASTFLRHAVDLMVIPEMIKPSVLALDRLRTDTARASITAKRLGEAGATHCISAQPSPWKSHAPRILMPCEK